MMIVAEISSYCLSEKITKHHPLLAIHSRDTYSSGEGVTRLFHRSGLLNLFHLFFIFGGNT